MNESTNTGRSRPAGRPRRGDAWTFGEEGETESLALQRAILDLVKVSRAISPNQAAKILDVPLAEVENAIGRCVDIGLLRSSWLPLNPDPQVWLSTAGGKALGCRGFRGGPPSLSQLGHFQARTKVHAFYAEKTPTGLLAWLRSMLSKLARWLPGGSREESASTPGAGILREPGWSWLPEEELRVRPPEDERLRMTFPDASLEGPTGSVAVVIVLARRISHRLLSELVEHQRSFGEVHLFCNSATRAWVEKLIERAGLDSVRIFDLPAGVVE